MAATTEELRFGGALLVILLGLIVIAVLALLLPVGGGWEPSDVIAMVGALTTFLGTVIGAFLGVQVGAASRDKSERLASRALAALPPDAANEVLQAEQRKA